MGRRLVVAIVAAVGVLACASMWRLHAAPSARIGLPAPAPAWVVGQHLPALTLVDDTNHPVALPSLGGAPTVLLFFRAAS